MSVSGGGGNWRGSTGTLWRGDKQRSPDILLSSARPVSATPPACAELDTPRSRRKGGLRKRFLSLTEGLTNLISGEKRDKSSLASSLKSVQGSPKKLRKSIFYVDRHETADTTDLVQGTQCRGSAYKISEDRCVGADYGYSRNVTDAEIGSSLYSRVVSPTPVGHGSTCPSTAPTASMSFPWVFPRLTRSMSQGSGGVGASGVRPVKAPPSPPPRRYTLWGLTPPSPNDDDDDYPPPQTNVYNTMRAAGNVYSIAKPSPPPPPIRCHHYSQLSGSSVNQANSPMLLTPPSSPLLFGSPRSWSSQHPSTLKRTCGTRDCRLGTNYNRYDPFVEDLYSSSPINYPYDVSYNEFNSMPCKRAPPAPSQSLSRPNHLEGGKSHENSPTYWAETRGNSQPRFGQPDQQRSSVERGTQTSGRSDRLTAAGPSGRVSNSPSKDRKSFLFGLGPYRGDWYRRKAAKGRKLTQQSGIGPEGVLVRRTSVTVEREGDGLGVTVRGGRCPSHPDKSRPLVITHVRTAGPVDREGTIQAGDRLVAVDGRCVSNCTMTEAQDILRSTAATVTLTIEYDVSVLTAVRQRGGALLVEVERPAATDLGLSFTRGPQDTVIIETIRTASIAERCGALFVGDTVTRLDGSCLSQLTAPEAMQLMRAARGPMLTLEIVPAQATCYGAAFPHLLPTTRSACSPLPAPCTDSYPSSGTCPVPAAGGSHQYTPTSCTGVTTSCSPLPAAGGPYPSCPSYCTIGRQTARNGPDVKASGLYGCSSDYSNRTTNDDSAEHCVNGRTYAARTARSDLTVGHDASSPPKRQDLLGKVNGYGDSPKVNDCTDIRTETLTVTLREAEGGGYGLVLRPPVISTDPDMAVPVLAAVDPYSPADRCGILCLGDRITAVNGSGTAGAGAAEVTQLIAHSRTTVTLAVEFDIRESNTAPVGSLAPTAVALIVKQPPLGLGISLAGDTPNSLPEQTCPAFFSPTSRGLHIASVTRGSPAHRSGAVSAGDLLLAVDGVPVSPAGDPQETLRRVQTLVGGTVTLKILRDVMDEGCDGSAVQYTVEVARGGGLLGLTLSGSEDPLTVLRVAALTPGGLAERTGAIHAGDRLLAINGTNLRDRPLSDAVRLLQGGQDTVTLRIARPRGEQQGHQQQQQGTEQQQEQEPHLMQLPPGLDVCRRIEEWAGVGAPSVDSAVESWGDSSGGGEPCSASPPTSPLPRSGEDSGLEGHSNSAEASESNDDNCKGQDTNNDTANATAANNNENSNNVNTCALSATSSTQTTQAENNTTDAVDSTCLNNSSSTAPTVTCVRLPSTSPPPTPDSGQSEGCDAPRPDWDEMIAALNTISESCRLTDVGTEQRRGVEVQSPAPISTSLHMGEGKEEGMYNVAAAELSHDTTCKTLPEEPGSEGTPQHIFRVALAKDPVYEDFGFSVSDGLYEKGVYVNRIRQGGPADRSGRVRPYDRILQVNDTLSHDFDCCLTVPLIAAAGDQLSLLLSRSLTVTPLLRRTPDIAVGYLPHPDMQMPHGNGRNYSNEPLANNSLENGSHGNGPSANFFFGGDPQGSVVYRGDHYRSGLHGGRSPGSATDGNRPDGNCYFPNGSQSMSMYGMSPMTSGYQCSRPAASGLQSLASFRPGPQSVMSHDSSRPYVNPPYEVSSPQLFLGSGSTNRSESPMSGQAKINYQKAQFLKAQIFHNDTPAGNKNNEKPVPDFPAGDANHGSSVNLGQSPSRGICSNQVLKSFGGTRPLTSLPGYRPQKSYASKSPSPSFENGTHLDVAAEVHTHPSTSSNRCHLLQWADQSLSLENPTTASVRASSQSPSLPFPKSLPTPPHPKSQLPIPPKVPLPPNAKSPLTPQLSRVSRRNVANSNPSSSYSQQRSVIESIACARDSESSTLQRSREVGETSGSGDLSDLERKETLSNGDGRTTILRTL